MRALFRPEVFQQPRERRLKLVVILSIRKIGDEVFAQFGREILAAVGIEALPRLDGLHGANMDITTNPQCVRKCACDG